MMTSFMENQDENTIYCMTPRSQKPVETHERAGRMEDKAPGRS